MRARRPAAQRTLALSIEPSNDEAPPSPPELPSKPPRPKSERGVRVACLRVPDLLLAAELRANPELLGSAFVVAAGDHPRAEVVSISPEADRQGVHRGSSVAQARTVCGTLRVRVASPALEQATRDALLDVALAFSPRACLAPRSSGAFGSEAAVFLDASGVDSLFHSEAGFAAALSDRAARLGLAGDVSLAASQAAALVVARQLATGRAQSSAPGSAPGCEVQVLPVGADANFLAPLPIDVFDPSDSLAEVLTRFGVHRVRDLLALPRRSLATRLGPEAMRLIALARGRVEEPPLPVPEVLKLTEAIDLDYPVERLEPLAFVLQGLLSRLCERLETRRLACGDLYVKLTTGGESEGRDTRRVGIPAPTLDLRVLMRLLSHALEARPPGGPVTGASIETEGLPVHSDQLDLFRPAGPAPAVLGATLSELESLCGSGRVGTPQVADDHRPDAYAIGPFRPGRPGRPAHPSAHMPFEAPSPGFATGPLNPLQTGSVREAPRAHAGPSLAIRALRPPVPAQVQLRHGRPEQVRSGIASGRVIRVAGPWRTTGGWWSREGHYAYDCFDVLTSDGTVSRLRYDHIQKRWDIDAVYD